MSSGSVRTPSSALTTSRNGKVNTSAIGTKSRLTLMGEPAITSGASTMWLLDASSSVCPCRAPRARNGHAADRAGAALDVLENEALAEHRLELIGIQVEVAPARRCPWAK